MVQLINGTVYNFYIMSLFDEEYVLGTTSHTFPDFLQECEPRGNNTIKNKTLDHDVLMADVLILKLLRRSSSDEKLIQQETENKFSSIVHRSSREMLVFDETTKIEKQTHEITNEKCGYSKIIKVSSGNCSGIEANAYNFHCRANFGFFVEIPLVLTGSNTIAQSLVERESIVRKVFFHKKNHEAIFATLISIKENELKWLDYIQNYVRENNNIKTLYMSPAFVVLCYYKIQSSISQHNVCGKHSIVKLEPQHYVIINFLKMMFVDARYNMWCSIVSGFLTKK